MDWALGNNKGLVLGLFGFGGGVWLFIFGFGCNKGIVVLGFVLGGFLVFIC